MSWMRSSRALIALISVGLVTPSSGVSAAPPVVSQSQMDSALAIKDVALAPGEKLHGVALDEKGQPLAEVEVIVSQLGREVARTTTDEAGRFSFQSLRGGLHLVRAGQAEALYRLWSAGTAPPHAQSSVRLTDSLTVRGQRPLKELFTSNAFIVGALVAGAIAIPIAVHDARNDKKSGS